MVLTVSIRNRIGYSQTKRQYNEGIAIRQFIVKEHVFQWGIRKIVQDTGNRILPSSRY